MGCFAQCNVRIGQAGSISTLHIFALFICLPGSLIAHGYILQKVFAAPSLFLGALAYRPYAL